MEILNCLMHGKLCTNPTIHHALKYHDPESEFYIGEKCVNCVFSKLEESIRRDERIERNK